MTKKHATDKYAQEILRNLQILIEASIETDIDIECCKDYEEVLICLDNVIDEFFETIDLLEEIQTYLFDLVDLDRRGEKTVSDDQEVMTQNIRMYEHLAAARREQPDYELAFQPESESSEEESLAMLFCQSQDYGTFRFEILLRICPWLDEHSTIRQIPGASDLYYLYEKGAEVQAMDGKCLLSPVVVIKLNKDRFVVTPDEIDRFRVKKFFRDNTGKALDEDGVCHQALRLI